MRSVCYINSGTCYLLERTDLGVHDELVIKEYEVSDVARKLMYCT
jgi:hypothetical protein